MDTKNSDFENFLPPDVAEEELRQCRRKLSAALRLPEWMVEDMARMIVGAKKELGDV